MELPRDAGGLGWLELARGCCHGRRVLPRHRACVLLAARGKEAEPAAPVTAVCHGTRLLGRSAWRTHTTCSKNC